MAGLTEQTQPPCIMTGFLTNNCFCKLCQKNFTSHFSSNIGEIKTSRLSQRESLIWNLLRSSSCLFATQLSPRASQPQPTSNYYKKTWIFIEYHLSFCSEGEMDVYFLCRQSRQPPLSPRQLSATSLHLLLQSRLVAERGGPLKYRETKEPRPLPRQCWGSSSVKSTISYSIIMLFRDNEAQEDMVESGVSERAEDREGKFLLYWMTTTTTSTSTSFTSTTTLATLACTPNGFTISACGW